MRNFSRFGVVAYVATFAVVAPSYVQAAIDATAVTDAEAACAVAGLGIGASYLIMLVTVRTLQWLRRAL
jgi:ABC-type sulfate transport system permease component